MKKTILFVSVLFSLVFSLYADIPSSKRPKAIDEEKAKAAAAKDESPEDVEKNRNIIKYGMASEISDLLGDLIKNDDPRYTEEIYDLFQVTRNSAIREKVLNYFTKVEDPCLEDFAVELLSDPYDERNEVILATFQYVAAVKTKEAIPELKKIIESENENFFNNAIIALGEVGGSEEAMFLAEYLDREDLSAAQRQALMRVCGKMHSVETWGRLVDIIEDEDENSFVRMYAAESIGQMQLDKSIPVLERNFDVQDPNLRQYIIKGLSNFPESDVAKNVILQGIRDDHWKVRQESIKACESMKLIDAVPFLIHRAKNDSEKVIKDASFTAIGVLNTADGNKFLIEQLTDKKPADTTKAKVVEVLLKQGSAGDKEILELAKETLKDDRRKTLRYAIGKELAKYDRSNFADICVEYLLSKDTTTISLGLDMFKNGKYSSAEAAVKTIAEDKKANAGNRKRAQKMLGLEEN